MNKVKSLDSRGLPFSLGVTNKKIAMEEKAGGMVATYIGRMGWGSAFLYSFFHFLKTKPTFRRRPSLPFLDQHVVSIDCRHKNFFQSRGYS